MFWEQSALPLGEWLKISASTTLGLLAGLVAEPLKAELTWHLKKRRIVHSLHRELAKLLSDMRDIVDNYQE
jgi:hypothetical protein